MIYNHLKITTIIATFLSNEKNIHTAIFCTTYPTDGSKETWSLL